MSPNEFPTIRIEVEGLKHTILHALEGHCEEINRYVEEGIDEALGSVNIQQIAKDEAEQCLKKSIKRYFDFGPGANAIREGVQEFIDSRLKGEE